MRFRKKPVVIEAVQWTGENFREIAQFVKGKDRPVDMASKSGEKKLLIVTLEGLMEANAGDWIICGVKGELYACKPDIFEETYELEEQ